MTPNFISPSAGDDAMGKISILIRGQVVYEPHSHSLYYTNDASSQSSLSIPASLCLLHLLEHQGQLVSSKDLLEAVWKTRGMNVSPNTLYQNLSLLRKALKGFSLDDGLIKTVPKRGFMITGDEDLVPFCPLAIPSPTRIRAGSESESQTAANDAPILTSTPSSDKVSCDKKHIGHYALTLLVLSFAGGLWAWFAALMPPPHAAASEVPLPSGCDIIYLSPVGRGEKNGVERQVSEIMRENSLACTPNHKVYFSAYTAFSPENYGRTLLTYCHLGDKGEALSCDNFYYLDWRTY